MAQSFKNRIFGSDVPNRIKKKIEVMSDNSLNFLDYKIEFFSKTNKLIDKIENISILKKHTINKFVNNKSDKIFKKNKYKKKKYYKKKIK